MPDINEFTQVETLFADIAANSITCCVSFSSKCQLALAGSVYTIQYDKFKAWQATNRSL